MSVARSCKRSMAGHIDFCTRTTLAASNRSTAPGLTTPKATGAGARNVRDYTLRGMAPRVPARRAAGIAPAVVGTMYCSIIPRSRWGKATGAGARNARDYTLRGTVHLVSVQRVGD